MQWWRLAAAGLLLASGAEFAYAGAEHIGQVSAAGVAVPGATVIAARGDDRRVTLTDERGMYRFANLAEGTWSIRVEMLGFVPATLEVVVSDGAGPAAFTLALQAPNAGHAAPAPRDGATQVRPAAAPPAAAAASAADGGLLSGNVFGAADGLLINGSHNNAASSPFAQASAFGNSRRTQRALYNGGLSLLIGSSAFDSRPYSFGGQRTPRPSYHDAHVVGTLAGPLKIPGLVRNGPNLLLMFQRTSDHNATTHSAVVPTARERGGDFSRSLIASGRELVDPATGLAFAGNVVPPPRISPQAASLLRFYPLPNVADGARYNYQTPILGATTQHAVHTRATQTLTSANQIEGTLSYQRASTDTGSVFGFVDASRRSTLEALINWSHRFSRTLYLRVRYQHTALRTEVTPFFANRENVSGVAGIAGNAQSPADWGPPNLVFSSGIAGFASPPFASNRDRAHAWGTQFLVNRGRHRVTVGGDVRLRHVNVRSQQNARGTFTFTGAATGSDLADFLLGLPHASAIGFGNADKVFRAGGGNVYITDDWRPRATVTATIAVRWDYEPPFRERFRRMANLDVAPDFTAVRPVLAGNPVGTLTGQRYPDSLLRSDWRAFQPRVAVAWRPIHGSSLVVRASVGLSRDTSAYQTIAALLAEQPPWSKTVNTESRATAPLTLANGFLSSPHAMPHTFAVDPRFRPAYAQEWQVSAQRDLPASLTITATYLGSRGFSLMQAFLPNTVAPGAVNPCPSCPAGFVYLTSSGGSRRHAGQLQIRRRLRNGVTTAVQYALATAADDAAAAFTGVTLSGPSIAQNWLDLDAERAPSTFDQRHLLSVQFQYTSGVGLAGGGLRDGLKGVLLNGWTVTGQLTAGSGLPLTPLLLSSVPGTAITGTMRPARSDESPAAAPDGFHLHPLAFTLPATGEWGNAGRNSVRGPAQFGLNAGLGRSFAWGNRLTLDWRLDATNVLNTVTFAALNTVVGSPQFGLPNQANPMRRLKSTLRLRF